MARNQDDLPDNHGLPWPLRQGMKARKKLKRNPTEEHARLERAFYQSHGHRKMRVFSQEVEAEGNRMIRAQENIPYGERLAYGHWLSGGHLRDPLE